MTMTLDTLRLLTPPAERQAIYAGLRGEERAYFRSILADLAERVKTCPRTYDQDGLGDAAVAHLHYFHGGADWWITELDRDGLVDQAFGFACLGDPGNAELGYISIRELVQAGVELDLHYTPEPLAAIKARLYLPS